MAEYELVVFDWDGTLMDSMSKIVTCARKAFAELNFDMPATKEIQGCIGLGLDEIWHRLCPDSHANAKQAFVDVYRKHWLSWSGPESRLYEGVPDVLEQLKRSDYYVAIATGKSRVGLDRDLANTGIGHFFDASRCADESRSKPHPEMLEYLLDYFAVDPKKTLMIGDTSFDLEMAQGARTDALAVTYGAHDVDRLEPWAPKGMIGDLRELVGYLGE